MGGAECNGQREQDEEKRADAGEERRLEEVEEADRGQGERGREHGRPVVAEGVEDRETIELLNKMGIDQVQGFYYARPMPIDELYDWMTIDNKVAWAIRQ